VTPTPTAPCPACDEVVPVGQTLDAGACPRCRTSRHVLYALADGVVTVDECEPLNESTDALTIPERVWRERAAELRDRPDPADEEREVVYP
jgi:hypothetical protein